MPRVRRGLADGQIYHVLNRGNGRQQVFHKEGDFQAFLKLLGEAKERHGVKVFAYCLMSNHFHLLLQAEEGEELSRCMQWLMTSHVRRYHRHYNTSGHVWQGRFKSFVVQQDAHLLTVARYIEANPVSANMVQMAGDWRWSSHGENSGRQPRSLTDPLPLRFDGDWDAFVNPPLSAKEKAGIQKSLERQAPFGSDVWILDMCRLLGLESTIRPRGRPRATEEK